MILRLADLRQVIIFGERPVLSHQLERADQVIIALDHIRNCDVCIGTAHHDILGLGSLSSYERIKIKGVGLSPSLTDSCQLCGVRGIIGK